MRSQLPTFFLAALFLLTSITAPTSPPSPQIPLLGNDKPNFGLMKIESLKVPGNSPAYLKGDPSKDILTLKVFNLIPKVPSRYTTFQTTNEYITNSS
jgi:hypothetical protein